MAFIQIYMNAVNKMEWVMELEPSSASTLMHKFQASPLI